MNKCGACGSRILMGGTYWSAWVFCDESCATNLKIALTEKLIPEADIEKQVSEVHQGACIQCSKEGPNDVYTTKKVTGMLLAAQWSTEEHVCCSKCAKKKKGSALLHCLLLGWWSPKAALTNIMYIPYNLFGMLLSKPTPFPSKSLTKSVKIILANQNSRAFADSMRNVE